MPSLRTHALFHIWMRWTLATTLFLLIGVLLVNALDLDVLAADAPSPAASAPVEVAVPESMRSAPFDTDRSLNVPLDFEIAVHARIEKARFMAVAPNGDLLVSQPSTGKVLLVRSDGSADPTIFDFATDLRRPHDIVFHTMNDTTYVYIAETHQINRFVYSDGDTTAQDREVVITDLPDSSTPELGGSYGHELKNIALDSNDKLYVSIASACNACESDTVADPVRGAVYLYDADGSNGRLFAQGLRNAEGLDFVPGTNDLWVVVNNRDNIAYPYQDDWDGDGTNDYGKIIQSYVDDHPPDEFTRVRDGGNYGWPFCNPTHTTPNGFDNMPFDRDVQLNPDGDKLDCATADRINKGIQAHSAPLGLTFLHDTSFPEMYRTGAATGLHGSWNRDEKTGYKIAYFPWDDASQQPGDQIDLVTGWLNEETQEVWGRPVDVAVGQDGDMFISDDYSGTIYRLRYAPSQVETPTTTATASVTTTDTVEPPSALPAGAYLPLIRNGTMAGAPSMTPTVSATPSPTETVTPTPSALPSDPALPAARDPLQWPFAQDSIWNMPIGADAVYVPAQIQPAGARGLTADEDIIILEPDAPNVDVIAHDAGWDRDAIRCDSIVTPTEVLIEDAPIPPSFSTDPGYAGLTPNHSAAILLDDGETIAQTQPFHRCGPGGAAVSQYHPPDDNIRTGDGIAGAHGGSGMSSLGGTLRVGELTPGSTLRHALKINLYAKQNLAYNDDGTRGHRWPALRADGYAGDSSNACAYGGAVAELEMGALLALKPDFDMAQLGSEPARIIAQALRDYGGYVVDDTCWDVYAFATEWGPDGRFVEQFAAEWDFPFETKAKSTCTDTNDAECQWAQDMATIFTSLYVVDNNAADTLGGGGTPRAPLAPPFAN